MMNRHLLITENIRDFYLFTLFFVSIQSLLSVCADGHSEPKPKPHLLGDSECTYGPSYWCSSPEAMKQCNVSH